MPDESKPAEREKTLEKVFENVLNKYRDSSYHDMIRDPNRAQSEALEAVAAEAVRQHEEAAMVGGPDRFVRASFATEWFTKLGWLPPQAGKWKDAEIERLKKQCAEAKDEVASLKRHLAVVPLVEATFAEDERLKKEIEQLKKQLAATQAEHVTAWINSLPPGDDGLAIAGRKGAHTADSLSHGTAWNLLSESAKDGDRAYVAAVVAVHEKRCKRDGNELAEKDAEIERLNNELAEADATMFELNNELAEAGATMHDKLVEQRNRNNVAMFDKLVEQRNLNNVEKTAMNSKLVKALRDKNEVQEQVVRLVATMRNAAQKLLRGAATNR